MGLGPSVGLGDVPTRWGVPGEPHHHVHGGLPFPWPVRPGQLPTWHQGLPRCDWSGGDAPGLVRWRASGVQESDPLHSGLVCASAVQAPPAQPAGLVREWPDPHGMAGPSGLAPWAGCVPKQWIPPGAVQPGLHPPQTGSLVGLNPWLGDPWPAVPAVWLVLVVWLGAATAPAQTGDCPGHAGHQPDARAGDGQGYAAPKPPRQRQLQDQVMAQKGPPAALAEQAESVESARPPRHALAWAG